MSGWPVFNPGEPTPPGPGSRRVVNLMVPVGVPGRDDPAMIHMVMPERDARGIANTSDAYASELGPLFEMIRDGVKAFLESEG